MIHIQVDEEFWPAVNSTELRKAAKTACTIAGLPADSEFTIVITGDEQVRTLNREYRKIDDATDVLSFPSAEKDPETGKGYLGDIIISHPRASQQAARAGHSSQVEICLLVIHGTLHLAGHDHAEKAQEKVMFSLQREALEAMNISIKGFSK
jgi:probable rRNA maturation factor